MEIDSKDMESLRIKFGQILESLSSILMSNQPWPELLSQFNATIAKYESLISELQHEKYSLCLVHPHLLQKEDPEFFPRVMLRTKLIPAVEDQQNELLAINDPSNSSQTQAAKPTDEDHVKKELQDYQNHIDEKQYYIQQLIDLTTDFKNGLENNFKNKVNRNFDTTDDMIELNRTIQFISSGIQ
ncbi:hypothetical protein HDV02_001920 [Globomyces sp. JEL0801]|nr:hypothetical protein HDV02_001920 [Globomyces sp. JEL0801]